MVNSEKRNQKDYLFDSSFTNSFLVDVFDAGGERNVNNKTFC